ncbi:MAG: secretin N-terminal domain-containing protein [Planctomycetota bacterium]|jgi:type IV pilus assembly protein PilQ
MRSFMMKYGGLKSLTLFIAVCLSCAIVAAENSDEDSEEKELLTDLERRMMKKIFIDVNELPIDMVIRQLAEQADVNLIKSPKVTGNVTVTLTDVSLEEALRCILDMHGCDYVVGKNIIRILSREEMPELYERLETRTFEIKYADITEVVKALKEIVSKPPDGMVSSVQGTSIVIVTDVESKIKNIEKLIEKIDRMTPQILVEARIYDITRKDKLDLGVEWQAGRDTTYGTTGITGIGNNPTGGETDPFGTGIFSGATGKTSGTTGALRFGWLNATVDIDVLLRAQQNDINAKLLANPRILVLDNETASIKIVSELPYQQLTESATGGTMGTTAFKEVGVELTVTPHLAARDEMIRLNLKPIFSVKVDDVTFNSAGLEYPQPVVDRREADTTLLIKNGQTVVLGGLRKKEVTKQINKIPLLGDVPLLGALFRFEGEDTVISELVVFITPWIVEQPTLSETEQQQYEVTDFKGPEPITSKAETANK